MRERDLEELFNSALDNCLTVDDMTGKLEHIVEILNQAIEYHCDDIGMETSEMPVVSVD